MNGIYLHIPYCVRKCLYCDFYSEAGRQSTMARYTDRMVQEIRDRTADKPRMVADTVYFGGGTPSLLPLPDIEKILSALHDAFCLSGDTEMTIEVNPGTVGESTLSSYRKMGFNRLSIGVQSFCDNELRALGRIHTAKDAVETVKNAHKAGFANISIDLMLAIPHQTRKSLTNTLEKAESLDITHVSTYSLIIEEGTPFFEHTPKLPDEDEERALYWQTKHFWENRGFSHYEISNFSLKGFESRHNLKYWEYAPYFGFGAAAHSFTDGIRASNVLDIDTYIASIDPTEDKIVITEEEAEREKMMLGFRLLKGVVCDSDKEPVMGLIKKGLLIKDGGRVKLTDRGLDMANWVFREFVE